MEPPPLSILSLVPPVALLLPVEVVVQPVGVVDSVLLVAPVASRVLVSEFDFLSTLAAPGCQ